MRRFLLRKRVLVPLGCGIALLLLGYFALLPWAVRDRVRATLRQLNLPDATFRVTRATPWTSTVRDIDAGGGNRIEFLTVTYSAGGLWDRRVDNIRVRGLHLTADARKGGVSFGPLDQLVRPRSTSQPSSSASTHASAAAAKATAEDDGWPFRIVRIDDATLVLRTTQRTLTIPMKGTVQWPQVEVEATPRDGSSIRAEIMVGDAGAWSGSIRGERLAGVDLTAIASAVAPGAAAGLSGDVTIGGTFLRDRGTTAINVTAEIAPPAAESAATDRELAGTNVTVAAGVLKVVGDIGPNGSLQVTASGVSLTEKSLGLSAEGVGAEVTLASVSPPLTPALDQTVTVAKLTASKLSLAEGLVGFRIEPGGVFRVNATKWKFLGGEVSAENVRVAPGEPVSLTLVVKDVELRDLLQLLAEGKAGGNGNVSGRIPMVIANGQVAFGEAFLEAVPGGRLSVEDEPTLESVAGAAAGAGGKGVAAQAQAQIRRDVVAALKDFEFTSLSARLKRDEGAGVVAEVNMKGRGRTGARQAIDYDLRVAGLEDLLKSLVGFQQALNRKEAADQ